MSKPWIDFSTTVEPHDFVALGWLDRLRPINGRCKHCLISRVGHPVPVWAPSRAVGDREVYPTRLIALAFEAWIRERSA